MKKSKFIEEQIAFALKQADKRVYILLRRERWLGNCKSEFFARGSVQITMSSPIKCMISDASLIEANTPIESLFENQLKILE